MLLQKTLKLLRIKKGYTQEQIANKLYISTQAVSKWEKGQSIPSIENLLSLSDIYDISVDELIQGSPFFRKPYLVGNKYSLKKGILFFCIWFFTCLFLTGFGYQPFWLFLLIFILGILLLFPTIFKDYWIIENNDIIISNFSKRTFKKIPQLLNHTNNNLKIDYSDISLVKIVYISKTRISPFDFGSDSFYLVIKTQEREYFLNLNISTKQFLPQFVSFLKRKGICVIDENNIIELLISDTSLYDYFNRNKHE